MSGKRTKRQRAIIRRRIFLSCTAAVLVAASALIVFAVRSIIGVTSKDKENNSSQLSSVQPPKEETPETFATVVSTGDIMVHSTQLTGALTADGRYDFTPIFKETTPYFKAADIAVANLEVTFGGTESGKYSGHPAFNTPDSLAATIKESGLNLLITANNHSYDTGLFGLKRTAQILKEHKIEFTGTKEISEDPTYVLKTVNGIKIGIADFTYETSGQLSGRKYLNGAILSEEANPLINSFSYDRIEEFYTNADEIIKEMKSNDADWILFYMHWGNEYQTVQNTWQKTIAQKLSDLGVNMIVGSHPHVIQPIELIHSQDGQTETVCLYSTGNFVSNQRQELMDSCPSGHTEDGLLFGFTLKKKGDDVTLTELTLVPTWVNKYRGSNGYLYTVYPLEAADWGSTKYGLDATAAARAAKSYERTKAIVKEGLTQCQASIGCRLTFEEENS